MQHDDEAASPLTVIVTFVLVAAALTAVAFFAFVDRTDEAFNVRRTTADGAGALEVTRVVGDFRWSSLDVRFVDPAGKDQAAMFLDLPGGRVDRGDLIGFRSEPPSGTYFLEARLSGELVIRSQVII